MSLRVGIWGKGIRYLLCLSLPRQEQRDNSPQDPEARVTSAIIAGDRERIVPALSSLLEGNGDPQGIVNRLMIPAIIEVGERYSRREFSFPSFLPVPRL